MNWTKLYWNLMLFGLSFSLSMMLIQHGVFIYSFPPNPAALIPVNPVVYLIMSIMLYFIFKLLHYASEGAEVLPDPDEDDP
jgi:hypothetical protein